MRKVTRYVDRLLRQRRPRPFVPTDEQAEAVSAAIALRGARPEDAIPRAEFVTALRGRLADQAARDGEDDWVPAKRRRGFLIGTASAASAVLGVATGRLLAGRSRSAPPTAAATLDPANGTWHTVLASADLVEGATLGFDTGTVTGFVTRSHGAPAARSGICTHQGCRLDLDRGHGDGRLACPCHHTFFRLDGTVITSQLPTPPTRLPAIQVRERDGAIQVYVPE
jgi:nitrite reductase/ring-hydroxylating ferredoxin subunit